ncbi:hypothetical protein [Flavobacterium sp. U410]
MKQNPFREEFTTELKIGKKEFIEKFNKKFEHSDINFFSEFFKSLSSRKVNKSLIGNIEKDSFKLKRNSKMNSFNYATAVAKGKISDSENGTIIEVKINGFDYAFIPLYTILGIVFFISFIGMFGDFQFGIGVFLSFGIYLFTRNNMLKDLKKLKIELTNTFENLNE